MKKKNTTRIQVKRIIKMWCRDTTLKWIFCIFIYCNKECLLLSENKPTCVWGHKIWVKFSLNWCTCFFKSQYFLVQMGKEKTIRVRLQYVQTKLQRDENFEWKQIITHARIHYLQQFVSQVSLNQPVVQSDVKELVLRPLGQAKHLLKLRGNDRFSLEMQIK